MPTPPIIASGMHYKAGPGTDPRARSCKDAGAAERTGSEQK